MRISDWSSDVCSSDLLRVAHELHRQRLDPRLERGREQQRLALLRHPVDDALDRRQEAHVEHALGFVEHQHFDRVELGAAALEVVDQAAGGGDEDVDAAAQVVRSEEHTSELQSLMRISYAVFCLKKNNITQYHTPNDIQT